MPPYNQRWTFKFAIDMLHIIAWSIQRIYNTVTQDVLDPPLAWRFDVTLYCNYLDQLYSIQAKILNCLDQLTSDHYQKVHFKYEQEDCKLSEEQQCQKVHSLTASSTLSSKCLGPSGTWLGLGSVPSSSFSPPSPGLDGPPFLFCVSAVVKTFLLVDFPPCFRQFTTNLYTSTLAVIALTWTDTVSSGLHPLLFPLLRSRLYIL
jgi:hypothetical protein